MTTIVFLAKAMCATFSISTLGIICPVTLFGVARKTMSQSFPKPRSTASLRIGNHYQGERLNEATLAPMSVRALAYSENAGPTINAFRGRRAAHNR